MGLKRLTTQEQRAKIASNKLEKTELLKRIEAIEKKLGIKEV